MAVGNYTQTGSVTSGLGVAGKGGAAQCDDGRNQRIKMNVRHFRCFTIFPYQFSFSIE